MRKIRNVNAQDLKLVNDEARKLNTIISLKDKIFSLFFSYEIKNKKMKGIQTIKTNE